MSYYEKYLKYKSKYLRLKQLGGDISRQNFVERVTYGNQVYPYAALFRNWVIPNVELDGLKCSGDVTSINLIAHGANGFTCIFECANHVKYTVKFGFVMQQIFAVNPREFNDNIFRTSSYIPTLKEYLNIRRFDSPYIMKAYNFFEFKPDEKKFIIRKDLRNEVVSEIVESDIVLSDDFKSNPDYKFVAFPNEMDGRNEPKKIPKFTGIILEYIQYGFNNLPKNLAYEHIISLFKQYIEGINVINSQGFIHKDIKADNLRYNFDGTTYQAKVIDLGELYNPDYNIKFFGASVDIASPKLIKELENVTPLNKEAGIKELENEKLSYTGNTSKIRDLDIQISNIIDSPLTDEVRREKYHHLVLKYDLYMLTQTFKIHGFINLTRDTRLYKIMNQIDCLMLNNNDVLRLLE